MVRGTIPSEKAIKGLLPFGGSAFGVEEAALAHDDLCLFRPPVSDDQQSQPFERRQDFEEISEREDRLGSPRGTSFGAVGNCPVGEPRYRKCRPRKLLCCKA